MAFVAVVKSLTPQRGLAELVPDFSRFVYINVNRWILLSSAAEKGRALVFFQGRVPWVFIKTCRRKRNS